MFKPMLASKVDDHTELEYPLLASTKLDGVRCVIINGVAYSRNMKPIRNKIVAEMLRGLPPFDGELVVGDAYGPGVFTRTMSGVMSEEGIPQFTFWVFDVILNRALPYNQRYELVKEWCGAAPNNVIALPHRLIKKPDALLAYEENVLDAGYEGVMVRHLDGPYKWGRSTAKEGYLLKLKRFSDSDAEVLGTVEKMKNENIQTRDELGRAKRSSHKDGKTATGLMGALRVRDCYSGVEFEIGTGFDDSDRQRTWAPGTIVRYKFQPVGVKDKPRFPVYLGIRDAADLS